MQLTAGTRIVAPGSGRAHQTALTELALALQAKGPAALNLAAPADSTTGGIHLALLADSPAGQDLCRRGLIDLHNTDLDGDGFAALSHAGTVYLLGHTPRGLLQAVYELQEQLADRRRVPAGWQREGVFRIARRIFHPRFEGWPGTRADVRYLSRLGASHCLVSHDWHGSRRLLQGYVTSPVFPEAVPPAEVAANHAGLRQLLNAAADYGLEAALWLTEFPCQGGPWVPAAERAAFLSRFPADCLSDSGTYEGRVLCFSHPQVQAFYRDLVRRFFTDFPEIGTLFVFGLDSSGEFCDPETCPRCRGLSRFDQRDRLLRFLLETGRQLRPGLHVLTTNWGWDRDPAEFLRRQAALPAGTGVYLAAQRDGWQCERQAHDAMYAAGRLCRERGQLFIGYDNLHWGDDSVHGLRDIQDFPFGIAAKLRRWHDLGVDGVFDHWGTWPEDVSCNSAACREFFLNPLAEALPICRRIARRQFGSVVAPHVLTAWQALEAAHARLSNVCTWSPWQWPAWYGGRTVLPTPEAWTAHLAQLAKHAESAKPAGAVSYNAGDLATRLQAVSEAWLAAWPHYEAAIVAMRRAVNCATDAPLGLTAWWQGSPPAPTRREHLQRQLRYLEANALTGREIGLHFGILALYERLAHDMVQFQNAARETLLADHQACLEVAAFFDALPDGPPPTVRAWPEQYRRKAHALAAYLKPTDLRQRERPRPTTA